MFFSRPILIYGTTLMQIQSGRTVPVKVPKCEIFDLFDFNDFYVIKFL
jgi:hypothetical protein